MLRKPLNERLTQPLSIIETWLSIVEPAFEAAKCSSDKESMMNDEDYNPSYPDIPPYDDTNLHFPEDAPPTKPG